MTDPTDDTQRHPIVDPERPGPDPASSEAGGLAASSPASSLPSSPSPAAPAQPGLESTLRADPSRPADSGWREPAWIPPGDRDRDRRPSVVSIVVGLAMIGIGIWFFLDRTLGLTLPRIQWSTVWPVILIVIGGLVLLRSFQRKA